MMEELFNFHARITERALECIAVNFIVIRKDYSTPIRMHHLNVATLPVNLDKSQPLQCSQHLSS